MGRQDFTDGTLIPKVIGGRRITRTADDRRDQEDHLVFRLPSRSNRTVNYDAALRVADKPYRLFGASVHGRDFLSLSRLHVASAPGHWSAVGCGYGLV